MVVAGPLGTDNKKARSAAARAIALVVVAMFCFHLSRFYLVIPGCSHYTRDGNYFQHCKDTPDWLTGKWAQLGGISAPVLQQPLEVTWVNVPSQADPTLDNFLPPPFHPPRTLS
ncbi:MAG: hypothetical protein IH846_06705 [Acidobacteria bacterium]|nr:hypothetical protein [Acidobacteriota bacterium]